MHPMFFVIASILFLFSTVDATAADPLPETAPNWKISLLAKAPFIHAPTALVEAPDGTIYLGQDPMDLNGPPNVPFDTVITLRPRNGRLERKVFADKLWAVMGLELIDDTLFVTNAPYLTSLRDTDGDGIADERVHLITGLGPEVPSFNGYNDHVASGIRAGMDGFLYFTFGDKGFQRATALDGTTLAHRGGGVMRIRPNGTGMEIVSSGLRNPLSTALNSVDDVFIYGNDDDAKRWPNAVIHTIPAGHYGYPYEFLDRPHRCLPIINGRIGGAGSQGVCFTEDGLAPQFRDNLFFTDWGTQELLRFDIEPAGGSYRLRERTPVVKRGALGGNFRPFSAAVGADGNSLLLVDWAFPSKLKSGLTAGRLYRLTYHGPDAVKPAPRVQLEGADTATLIGGLRHPARRQRLDAQRRLSRATAALPQVLTLLADDDAPSLARQHALWVAHALGGEKARQAIVDASKGFDADLQRQAIRAISSDGVVREAIPQLVNLLKSPNASVRRDAAIALGRAAVSPTIVDALLDGIGDDDTFVAWSIRMSLQRLNSWDSDRLAAAVVEASGTRRQQLIWLLEDVWEEPVVNAWELIAQGAPDSDLRQTAHRMLAALYFSYPPWDGSWFGTNPLIGKRPTRTHLWSRRAAAQILAALERALDQKSPPERGTAIKALARTGSDGVPALVTHLPREKDAELLQLLVATLGGTLDARTIPVLSMIAVDESRDLALRQATVESLIGFSQQEALATLHSLVTNPATPAPLIAIALPALGSRDRLEAAQLVKFFDSGSRDVQIAALRALALGHISSARIEPRVLEFLESNDHALLHAALRAAGARQYRGANGRLIELFEEASNLDDSAALRGEIQDTLAAMPAAAALDVYLSGLASTNGARIRACSRALLAIRAEVRAELTRRVQTGDVPPGSLPGLERILSRFESIDGWRAIGPFPRETSDDLGRLADIDFNKTYPGAGGRVASWKPHSVDISTGTLDLSSYPSKGFGFDTNNTNRVNVFAHASFESPKERDAVLLLGSSGSLQVWINGSTVYFLRDWAGRPFAPDDDIVRVRLRKGRNEIVVKSHAGIGRWRFAARVSHANETFVAPDLPGQKRAALRAFALSARGDARAGQGVFFDKDRANCGRCHAVRGVGGTIGPDLAGFAAKYDRAEAIRSILEPSQRLTTGYTSFVVAKTQGDVLVGLVREESTTSLTLVDAEGKLHKLSKTEITARRPTQVSLMAEGLVDRLSPEDFRHLVEFLMSLRTP